MAPLKRRRGSTPKQARLAAVAMQGACGPHTHLTADQENSRCSSRGDALVTGSGGGGGGSTEQRATSGFNSAMTERVQRYLKQTMG
jgi:hypothetical protein